MEDKYQLGYGIKPKNINSVFVILDDLLNKKNIDMEWSKKRRQMLNEKIDLSRYLIDFIENYRDNIIIFKGKKKC